MTVKDFKLWLVRNDHTQKSLAKKLKLTDRTITNYVSNESFPFTFVLSLVAIENGLNSTDLKG